MTLVSLVMLTSVPVYYFYTPTTLISISKEITNILIMSQPQTIGPGNHLKHVPFIKTNCLHAMTLLAFHPVHSSSRN